MEIDTISGFCLVVKRRFHTGYSIPGWKSLEGTGFVLETNLDLVYLTSLEVCIFSHIGGYVVKSCSAEGFLHVYGVTQHVWPRFLKVLKIYQHIR